MNRQDRDHLQDLLRSLNQLKAFNPEMPLQHAVAFLQIAIQPGITITELAQATGSSFASASRHAQALGRPSRQKEALVVTGFGKDGRTKALLLSCGGVRFANAVVTTCKHQ